jgi:hypothetical protein
MFQHIRCCLEGSPANFIQSHFVVAVVAGGDDPRRFSRGFVHNAILRPIDRKVPFDEASLVQRPMPHDSQIALLPP